jgi:hypothetical protein
MRVASAWCAAHAGTAAELPSPLRPAAATMQEDTQRYWRSVLEAPPGSPNVVPQLTQVGAALRSRTVCYYMTTIVMPVDCFIIMFSFQPVASSLVVVGRNACASHSVRSAHRSQGCRFSPLLPQTLFAGQLVWAGSGGSGKQ